MPPIDPEPMHATVPYRPAATWTLCFTLTGAWRILAPDFVRQAWELSLVRLIYSTPSKWNC